MFNRLFVWALACLSAVSVGAQVPSADSTTSPMAGLRHDNTPAITPDSLPGSELAAFIETTAPLTLAQAVNYALAANAGLAAAAREVRAFDGARLQGSLRPNPELDLQVEDLRDRNRSTTLALSQRIERGGKREARMAVAEAGQGVAARDFVARQRALRAQVEAAFQGVVGAQENLRIARGSLELAEQVSAVAAKRVKAGKVSPIEETRARLAEASIRAELGAAVGDLRVARTRLSTLWGNPQPRFDLADGALDGEIALPELDALLVALDAAPLIERARAEATRRRAVVELERSRGVQDVTVSAGMRRNEELGLNQMVFGVSIPLAMNDRNQGALLEAVLRADQAKDEVAALRMELSARLARAHERASTARELVQALERDILPGADSAFRAATTGFELGKFTFLEVLDAQRTLFQARTQYVRALTDMHDAMADLRSVVGDGANGQ
ncbi:MAG: TolC family protein [Methyloversatilis sp.]|jgi:cobalt-zinc-cadmium efflux system outer membrane protein|uniref:TolC family protein n=1 Tax=Methyloversatilis sp. TaxID=2569862 RepID=UPI001A40E1ED|nr:TolC family protein [Methyloversatilis sp.]MBL8474441.1 TolC family protein [Methyloversatilis sp.]